MSFDAASQINSPGYKYDARGRLTQSPEGAFKWNGASQVVGIGQTTLTYNGLGEIASRGMTQFGYNYALGLAPIVAETSDTKPLRYYVWTPGGELLYAIENDKPLFYHFDRTGSTLALTDASGAVTDAYAYDPYGKMLGHTGKSDATVHVHRQVGCPARKRDVVSHARTLLRCDDRTVYFARTIVAPDRKSDVVESICVCLQQSAWVSEISLEPAKASGGLFRSPQADPVGP